eukprot:TRINITY_DN5521_c0_g1_i3.p1 TRINITY_DN5521_c0_g1~~TRINITY_DN5521_c0_g1_i3.p1  ORF type:complete len:341 (+),score=72.29 TRINITY_DN5521_c0_g1_i3:33-1025(+)
MGGKFSQDGSVFCAASQDGAIHLVDSTSWKTIKSIEARDVGWSIIDIDYSPDQRFVIYSSWSAYIHMCNVDGDYELHEALELEPTCMFGIRFSPNNREILAGCRYGSVMMYDVERKRRVASFRGHEDDINAVCYVQNNPNMFATASDDTLCKIWDQRDSNRRCVGGFIGHQQGLTSVSSSGNYILTNSKDQSLKLWDLRKMHEENTLDQYTESRTESDFDYRWQRFHRSARVSRAPQDNSLNSFVGHSVAQTLIRADFSPQHNTAGRYVYSGSANRSVYIYDILTSRIVDVIDGHRDIVRDVSWHPYLPLLATSSWDSSCGRYEYRMDKV